MRRPPLQSQSSDAIGKSSAPAGADPDPSLFETEKVAEGSEPSIPHSTEATPLPTQAPVKYGDINEQVEEPQKDVQATQSQEQERGDQQVQDFPEDVKSKLRRLTKLESKYQGAEICVHSMDVSLNLYRFTELLRAYRRAHARNSAIEPFESHLRESTPLTSINDPAALVEYLSQLNLRGDMVMEELKTVSKDRDDIKGRLEQAEQNAREAYDEVTQLRTSQIPKGSVDHKVDGEPAPSPDSSINGSLAPRTSKDLPPIAKSSRSARDTKVEGGEDVFSIDDELPRLQAELSERKDHIQELETQNEDLSRNLKFKENELTALKSSNEASTTEAKAEKERVEDLEQHIKRTNSDLQSTKTALEVKENEIQEHIRIKASLEQRILDLSPQSTAQVEQNDSPDAQGIPDQNAPSMTDKQTPSSKNKKNKKKKKKAAPSDGPTQQLGSVSGHAVPPDAGPGISPHMKEDVGAALTAQSRLDQCFGELEKKNGEITRLNEKLKTHAESLEEIEHLREELLNVGYEHVEIKDRVKMLEQERNKMATENSELNTEVGSLRQKLEAGTADSDQNKTNVEFELNELRNHVSGLKAERDALQESVDSLNAELSSHRADLIARKTDEDRQSTQLSSDLQKLRAKADSLQMELTAAQHLASSRWKELSGLQNTLQKSRPEIASLRSELADLRGCRDELTSKNNLIHKLESRESSLGYEIETLKQSFSEREDEIKLANDKASQESTRRSHAEEASRKSDREVQRSRADQREAEAAKEDALRRLARTKAERDNLSKRISDLESQLEQLSHDTSGLREEIQLKTAQHASAQNLMNSVRDQASEMGTQLKEANERAESLEAELTDAHRLMNERGREGETMRRILADIESRADRRVKEMRERMDIAVQERDRAEDEASTIGRRRAREMDDLKNRIRDAERDLRRIADDKADLERTERDLRQRNAQDAQRAEQSGQELSDVRKAMGELRDALDEGERQSRELESEKMASQKALEDAQSRIEKLQKSNKVSLTGRRDCCFS